MAENVQESGERRVGLRQRAKRVRNMLETISDTSITLPNLKEPTTYAFWYATADDPEAIIYDWLDEESAAGKNGAVMALHTHTAHGRGPSEAGYELSVAKYGTGSDGAASLDEMLIAASQKTDINIYAVTDHATLRDPRTTDRLADNYRLPYGVGLGEGAVRRARELKSQGRLRKDFHVVKGAELDIGQNDKNGIHIVVLNLKYGDLNPLFKRVLRQELDLRHYPAIVHEGFCNKINKVAEAEGVGSVVRYLQSLPDVFVIAPHYRTPITGAGGEVSLLADVEEAANGEALALYTLPQDFMNENGFNVATPAALYVLAMPLLDRERSRNGKGPERSQIYASDTHSPVTSNFYLTVDTAFRPEELEALADMEDPSGYVARKLKADAKDGALIGGLNPNYWDPQEGDIRRGEMGEMAMLYFQQHTGQTVEEWGRVVLPVAKPIGRLLSGARHLYQELIRPSRYGERAESIAERIGEDLGINGSRHACLRAPEKTLSYAKAAPSGR